MLPLALVYDYTDGAMWAVQLFNILLGVIAVGALLSILDFFYPETPRNERVLATMAFAAMPAIAAGVLNTNLDFGMLVTFLVLLAALLREQRIIAAVAGSMLVLSKEPGIAIWASTVGAYLLSTILRREGTLVTKIKKSLRLWPLALTLAAYGGGVVYRVTNNQPILWSFLEQKDGTLLSQMTSFSLFDPVFVGYMVITFIINFAWIPSLFIIAGVSMWLCRKALGYSPSPHPIRRELIATLFILLTYILTRYHTFLNVRYFLPLLPMLILASYHALVSLLSNARVRCCILSIMIVLFGISTFRTVDPVARRIFGTFQFGSHELLHITSLTKECCGKGRDQLVYNLQFTAFDNLLNQVLAELNPSQSEPLVMAQLANFYFLDWVTNTVPPRRSFAQREVNRSPVTYANPIRDAKAPPAKLYWVDIPYADGTHEYETLLESYSPTDQKTFTHHGYSLTVTTMARK
jgi:hypothetical protein